MSQLYCGDCQNYLMGSDGQCHDCECGWNQPVETYEKENTELETEVARLQKENAELKAEVKEWLCLDCNTVFPSESIPNSFSCLICPKCDGKRMPKNTAIIKVLQAESAAQAKRIAELEKPPKPKMAPVQGYVQGIPWDIHLEAYNAYCKRYGAQQALIEGGCRGGFGVGELDMFIPGWREKLSLVGKLNAEIESLRKQVEDYEFRFGILKQIDGIKKVIGS